MQKGINFTEIHQKRVWFALLKRDLPQPNIKNKFIKNFENACLDNVFKYKYSLFLRLPLSIHCLLKNCEIVNLTLEYDQSEWIRFISLFCFVFRPQNIQNEYIHTIDHFTAVLSLLLRGVISWTLYSWFLQL